MEDSHAIDETKIGMLLSVRFLYRRDGILNDYGKGDLLQKRLGLILSSTLFKLINGFLKAPLHEYGPHHTSSPKRHPSLSSVQFFLNPGGF